VGEYVGWCEVMFVSTCRYMCAFVLVKIFFASLYVNVDTSNVCICACAIARVRLYLKIYVHANCCAIKLSSVNMCVLRVSPYFVYAYVYLSCEFV
jgi:hypothetical protein